MYMHMFAFLAQLNRNSHMWKQMVNKSVHVRVPCVSAPGYLLETNRFMHRMHKRAVTIWEFQSLIVTAKQTPGDDLIVISEQKCYICLLCVLSNTLLWKRKCREMVCQFNFTKEQFTVIEYWKVGKADKLINKCSKRLCWITHTILSCMFS